jgi:hypothetical protein
MASSRDASAPCLLYALTLGAPQSRSVEDCSDLLLAGGVAGHDVEELLGGRRALSAQLVDQGLADGPGQECLDDVSIVDIGQRVALPREALDILMKSLYRLLLAVL